MAFFDGFAGKAKAYADIAADKAKDVAFAAADKAKELKDTAKINMAISAEQHEIEKNYRAIGEWFVAEHQEDVPDAIRDVVSAINASRARIAELEATRAGKDEEPTVVCEVPELKTCPVCGAASNSRFCPECGAALDTEAKPE